jgi:hypothetical protein
MPIKKDGLLFELHPSPAKGSDGRNILYARPVSGRKITMEQIDAYCAKWYGIRSYELTRAFEVFLQAAGQYLAQGYRIETPLGSFSARLALDGTYTDPEKVKGRNVRYDGVEYNSGKLWDEQLEKWNDGFRNAHNPDSQQLLTDTAKLEEVMRLTLKNHNGYITAGMFARASGLTDYSARKLLNQWTESDTPKLLRTRMGKEFIYTEV